MSEAPHDLGFSQLTTDNLCHDLVRRDVDIHVILRLMGHSSVTTTTRYLRLSDADLTAAVDRAFPAS
jgi:site-specific recombinase XerD